MAHLARPRQFEHVQVPDQIGLGIGVRVLERIAHAGLRAEVNDAGEVDIGERLAEAIGVTEIDVAEIEP